MRASSTAMTATCPQCSAPVDGTFCENCGAFIDNPLKPESAPGKGLSENTASALCYLLGFVTGAAFLHLEPHRRNPKVRFHAWQAIFAHLGAVLVFSVAGFVQSTVSMLTGMDIPGWSVVFLSGVALWVFVMWKAYQGVRIELPVVGALAKSQAGG